MNYERKIKYIYSRFLNESVEKIEDKSIGMDQRVFLIKTNKRKSVIRFSEKNNISFSKQAWFAKRCKEVGIKAPKTYFLGKSFLVEEQIRGNDFDHFDLTLEQQKNIMFDLGKELKKLHSIRTKGYGLLDDKGNGKDKTWEESYEKYFYKFFDKVKEHKILRSSKLKEVRGYFERNRKIIRDFNDPRLLHYDIGRNNLMVYNGKYSGIVDFGDANSGDPMAEFSRHNSYYYESGLTKSLFKGYGKVDMKKVNFYSVAICLLHIYKFKIVKPRPKKLKKRIEDLDYFLKN